MLALIYMYIVFISESTASQSSEELSSFLFPEWELVTEPEELPAKDEELHEAHSLDQKSMTCLNNGTPFRSDLPAWYFHILSRNNNLQYLFTL